MIVAAAQTTSNGLEANLQQHRHCIELAAQHEVDFLVFPEMSMTNYDRAGAAAMAFVPNDERLAPLLQLAVAHRMTIVAGAPIQIDASLHIGAFVLHPDGSTTIYTKQHLHGGEEEYFVASSGHNPQLRINNEQISLAICADIDHAEHARAARAAGSTMYAAGIFFTPNGIDEAHGMLSGYARQHNMCVLMANYCGPAWELEGGGKSGFWNNKGKCIVALDAAPGLVIAAQHHDDWTGKKITL